MDESEDLLETISGGDNSSSKIELLNPETFRMSNNFGTSPEAIVLDPPQQFFEMKNSINRFENKKSMFKRWNSMPMGINSNYCVRCPEPSSSSSSEDEDDDDDTTSVDQNNSDLGPTNLERKSASICVYDRRPSSASSGTYAIRHRSSSSALYLASSIPIRLLDKGIEKLKREANVRSCIETDYAGEKMSVTGAAIMYSMDEFNITDPSASSESSTGITEQRRRTQSLTEPVHVLTNLLPASCSPSPTRIAEKQCYSPSMQQVVRSIAMSPTPSPSPTRRHCINRSLSPIALRTACGMKRKYEPDSDGMPVMPSKRANYSTPTTPPVIAIESPKPPALFPLPPQSLNHSLSESSIDSECSISTISSNISGQSIFHHPLSINAIYGNSGNSSSSTTTTMSTIEDFPIIEESIAEEDQ